MTRPEDIRLEQAKAMPIEEVAQRLGIEGLRRFGVELVGPCPNCGGTDRFGINTRRGVFQCRKRCSASPAGDQIALVRHVLGLDFRAALEWLCGPAEGVSEAEIAERRRKARESRERAERIARNERMRAIRRAREIWHAARPAQAGPVREYLDRRGLTRDLLPDLPMSLRYEPEADYVIPVTGRRGEFQRLHRGPAMVAAVVDATGRVTAVHRTFIDLDHPKGKLVLADPRKEGAQLPTKKVLGSKKGGAIRLSRRGSSGRMLMGEGIETTLSAMVSAPDREAETYWCGVDLGNMAGRRQSGRGMKYAGLPDLTDRDAWVPPDWVDHLIFLQDGDSEPRLTKAMLQAGLRRAMARRPDLRGEIAHAGEGRDFNDILMGARHG